MCLQINTITTTRKPRITHCRQRNPNSLRTLPMSANTLLSFSIGLWNCQSAVNKADFITFITSHSRLNLMALTETWNNATPAALSNNFSFSHTPRLTGRGTGLLTSNNWKFTPLSSPSLNCSLLCPPPPPPSSILTADDFGTFFINTITNLTAQFSTPQSVKHILPANINSFTYFSPLSEAEISKLILSSHPTTCLLDPIPSHLLQVISPAVVPALTHIVNTSLQTGFFSLSI